MKLKLLFTGLLFGLGQWAFSQSKEIENREQLWLGYFNQTRFTKHSGLWVDLHLRLTNDFIKDMSVSILRGGYTYYLADVTRLTAGYAYVTQYSTTGPDVPEHRLWQQVQWFEHKRGFSLAQWFRTEERFRTKVESGELTNAYNFNWRFRYNFTFTLPLKGKSLAPGTPFLVVSDELFVNAGKNIINNYFDQNRLFAGVGYQFNKQLNANIGYLNVFQQLAEPGKFVNINAIRLFVYHNLDFRTRQD